MVLLQYLSQFLTNIIKDSPRVWKVGQALSVVGHRYESYAVEDASFFLQYISARVALCGFDWLKRAGQLRLRLRFAFLRFHGVVPLARPRPATLRAIRATVGSKRQTRIATTTISHRNRVRSSPTEFARGCLRALSVYGAGSIVKDSSPSGRWTTFRTIIQTALVRLPASWRSASCVFRPGSPVRFRRKIEKIRSTLSHGRTVMSHVNSRIAARE